MLSVTYSPAEVAARWGCKVDKVLHLINSNQLRAINVATNRNGGKPRWRLTDESIDAFERSRENQPKPVVTRRRKKSVADIPSYF